VGVRRGSCTARAEVVCRSATQRLRGVLALALINLPTALRAQGTTFGERIHEGLQAVAIQGVLLHLLLPQSFKVFAGVNSISTSGHGAQLTGIDTFRPASPFVDQRLFDLPPSTGVQGGAEVDFLIANLPPHLSMYFRSGATFFSNKSTATFQNFAGGPNANGTVQISRNWTIPVFGVASMPVMPSTSMEFYLGGQITNRELSLDLREAAAPLGPPTTASRSFTSFNPAGGFGVVHQIRNTPVSIRGNVTFEYVGAEQQINALSANFLTEQYILLARHRVNTIVAFSANLDLPEFYRKQLGR
jgi:hypothetical protein